MTVSNLLKFDVNSKGRDFIVGDIHGCTDQFSELLNKINFDHDIDRMFSVGDLIDRGPYSEFALMLSQCPWFFSIRGNHEQMLVDTYDRTWSHNNYMMNGGNWALELAHDYPDRFEKCVNVARSLPIAMEVKTEHHGTIGICHAETGKKWSEEYFDKVSLQRVNDIQWGRNRIRWSDDMGKPPPGIDMTVHGHTPTKGHVFNSSQNAYWIDTGVFATGVLTCMCVSDPDITFFSTGES